MSNPYGSPAVPQGNYNLGSPAIPNPSTPSIYTPGSTPHQQHPPQSLHNKPSLTTLSPLPSSSIFAQNLIKVEEKVTQLQTLNHEIYTLLNSTISPTGSTTPLSPPDPSILSSSSSTSNNNTSNSHIQLIYEKKSRVQELIKSISADIIQNNFYFLIPILSDPSFDIIFASEDTVNTSSSSDSMNTDQPIPTPTTNPPPPLSNSTKLDSNSLQQKVFLEKFQHHLTSDVTSTQSNQWDSLVKERDKLIKNTDRAKLTLLNKIK